MNGDLEKRFVHIGGARTAEDSRREWWDEQKRQRVVEEYRRKALALIAQSFYDFRENLGPAAEFAQCEESAGRLWDGLEALWLEVVGGR